MNTENKIQIPSLGLFAKIADFVVYPFMYLVSGTFKESSQQTLPWNNLKLSLENIQNLSLDNTVSYKGLQGEKPRWKFIIPIFHLPIFGGWKNYVVLEPTQHKDKWHVGWITDEVNGVSLIPVSGPLRVLLGPIDVKFFGINDKDNTQIKIKEIGKGKIGDSGPYCKFPLF